MELFISIIILLDSDAVTELIYELFWRYLDSNLEETILMVQLSTIQKVIDIRFVHFLVCQRIIRFQFVQCAVVSLYFWIGWVMSRWGSRSQTGLFESRFDYSIGFYYQYSVERTPCIDRRSEALSGAGQIEPFPTNAARRFYKTN